MGRKPPNPKNGAETIRYAEHHPDLRSMRCEGDHFTFEGPDGRMTATNSKWEYPGWLRKKVVRQLIAIGLGVLAVLWMLP